MLSFSGLSNAFSEDNEELSLLYGDDDFVSIATGRKQLIAEAPAVASVITAEDIAAMGAQNLTDVLESVPGVHVSLAASNYNPVIVMRGVRSDLNQQVLLLVNGLPIKNAALGDRGEIIKAQSIRNIARIEVIRGPGSAMFGADALSGVINIITKSAEDIAGVETGVAGGSFGTEKAWFLYGGQAANWDVAFGLDAEKTDGFRAKIGADQQTLFDGAMMTSASLAPGHANLARERVSLFFDAHRDEWQIRASYQGVFNDETGAGVAGALDPEGKGDARRFTFDVTYHPESVAEDWDTKATFSFYDIAFFGKDYTAYPAGAFGGFPNGVVGNPELYERHYGLDLASFYSGFDAHTIRLGVGYQYLDLYRVEDSRNFNLTAGGVPIDLGAIRDVPSDQAFTTESLRKVGYLFAQDEWRFAKNWTLFAGARYDHFSDFGGTFNPRLALVWSKGNLSSKLLYGRAFRAPSFAEISNRNNPVNVGNKDVKPEIIDTYELAFDYAYSPDLSAGLNLFYYEINDLIRFTPMALNEGMQVGRGIEVEFDWLVNPATTLTGSFSLQRSKDIDAGSDVANVPQEQLYLALDKKIYSGWAINSRLNWIMGRERDALDARKDIDDYLTLDLTLKGKQIFAGLDLEVSVFNLTDENAKAPSQYNRASGTVALPGDLPLARRSFIVSISKQW